MTHDSGTSRRQFVKAVGATGAAAGVTGYVGGDTVGEVQNQGGTTTVQWAADSNVKDVEQPLQQALHDVGLSNDIEISVLAGPNVTGNRRAQYQQWLSAGRSKPDLLMMDSGWTIPFIVRDQLLNLTDRLPQGKVKMLRNQYLQRLAKTGQPPEGNDIYGVPFFPDIATIQYRKDLFRQAGHQPQDSWATESMRWQQFSNIVSDVQSQTNTNYGFTFQADAYEGLACCDFNEFMTSWGGAYFGNPRQNLFGPVGERPVTLAQKPVVDSVRMVRSLIHGPDAPNTLDGYKQIAPQAVLQWSEEPSRKPFTSGNAVTHRNWTYSININGADDAFGEDLGVMPIPYAKTEQQAQIPATGGPTSALGGWLTSINPNSKKQEAALEVITSMMNEEFMFRLFELLGWVPPNTDLLQTQRARQVPIMGRYVEQLRVAAQAALPRPVTVVWPQESTQIAQQVNSAYSQGGQPQQAMQRLQRSIKAIEQRA